MRRFAVRTTLMTTFSLMLLVAFFCIALIYTGIQVPALNAQTEAGLMQNARAIMDSIETELDQMSTVALSIAYSTMIKDRFFSRLAQADKNYSDSEDAKVLSDLLAVLIFPNRPVDQINLYARSEDVVASGLHNDIYREAAASQPWYEDILRSPNRKIYQFTGSDGKLSKFFTGELGKQFVSYILQNYDNFNNPYGFIEVKQRLSRVLAAAINYGSVYGEQLYVFDNDGLLLFPFEHDSGQELYTFAKQSGFSQKMIRYPHNGSDWRVLCAPSEKTDFSTVMMIGEQALQKPALDFTRNIALVTVWILLFAVGLTFFAARQITAPIGEMCKQISDIDLAGTSRLPKLTTRLTEIDGLHRAFSAMQRKLAESYAKQRLLQLKEMQSQMLALQSQMNPHFLFNSLAAVQTMAEEGLNDEIALMCQSMAGILRYISSNSEPEVPLRDELRYTTDYLLCMSIRYQGELTYQLHIPREMEAVRVPKLSLQLLVENAVKSVTTRRPPYFIEIAGLIDERCYEISIRDNGPGFSGSTMDMLRDRIDRINKTGLLPSLEINGMGLLNVYIRYRLLHGENLIFRLENQESGGACITIGEVLDGTKV